jgi:hypothetical protein
MFSPSKMSVLFDDKARRAVANFDILIKGSRNMNFGIFFPRKYISCQYTVAVAAEYIRLNTDGKILVCVQTGPILAQKL